MRETLLGLALTPGAAHPSTSGLHPGKPLAAWLVGRARVPARPATAGGA